MRSAALPRFSSKIPSLILFSIHIAFEVVTFPLVENHDHVRMTGCFGDFSAVSSARVSTDEGGDRSLPGVNPL